MNVPYSLLARLGEGSTHAGLAVIAGLGANLLPPSLAATAAPWLSAIFAALAVLIPDSGAAERTGVQRP